MTDTIQLVLGISAAALPTITVLVGILLNRSDTSSIRNEMGAMRAQLQGEMAAMRTQLQGEMGAMRAQFHNDVLMLLSSDKEQDQRITRLENR